VAQDPQPDETVPATLLTSQVKVVNIGLESFAHDLAAADVPVIHVEWSPPAGGDPELADLVSKLGA
jgi:FdrA protein